MLGSFIHFLIKIVTRCLKGLLRASFQALCLLFMLLVLLVGVLGLIKLLKKNQAPTLKPGTLLVLDLSEPLAESNLGLYPFDSKTTTLWSALQALKHGAEDDAIAGLLIRVDSPFPSAQGEVLKYELRQAICRFKEKKPVRAYLRESSRQDYVLASCAHKVYMHPLSTLSLLGAGYEGIFFGEAFEKYGLKAHVFKCGKYKSATEPFTESRMSPESREQLSVFVQEVWQDSLATIASNRNLDSSQLNTFCQSEGLFHPARALDLGLIDGILHEDEVCSQFEAAVFLEDTQDYSKMSLRRYAESIQAPKANRDTLALVYADGTIAKNTKDWETLNVPALLKTLHKLKADETVKGVLIRMNSPGGEASLSEDLRRAIALIAAQKPVVISMGSYAASGGYWASLGASKLCANPFTITGSIGVFGILFNWEKLGQTHGIHADHIGTSPFSSLYSTAQAKTEAELNALQGMCDYTYKLFLSHVSAARGLSLEEAQKVAQGRIVSGTQALQLGLVDAVGTLEDALAFLTEGKDSFKVEEYPKAKTYTELWEDFWSSSPTSLTSLFSYLPASLRSALGPKLSGIQLPVLTLFDASLLPL